MISMNFPTTFAVCVYLLITMLDGKHSRKKIGIDQRGDPLPFIDPFAIEASMASASSSSSALSSSSTGRLKPSVSSSYRLTGVLDLRQMHTDGRKIVQPKSNGQRRVSVLSKVQSLPVILMPEYRKPTTWNHKQDHKMISLSIETFMALLEGRSRRQPRRQAPSNVNFIHNQRLLQIEDSQYVQSHISNKPETTTQFTNSQKPNNSMIANDSNVPVSDKVLVGEINQPAPIPVKPVLEAAFSDNHLQVSGQQATGDLIVKGPGGSITIGADLLSGISQSNVLPIYTEFEELEQETTLNSGSTEGTGERMRLTEPGRGSIVIDRSPSGDGINSMNNSQSESKRDVESKDKIASIAPVSSRDTEAVLVGDFVVGGTGSGQIITISNVGPHTQTITINKIQENAGKANASTRLHVPANATFIVGG